MNTNLDFVTTDEGLLGLAQTMKNRCYDPDLDVGDGLVATIRRAADKEPVLAVMPYALYDAIAKGLDDSPTAVDPTLKGRSYHNFSKDQLAMLSAYIRLELGIDVEAIDKELARQAAEGSEPNGGGAV